MIDDIPDFSALKKLSEALWQQDTNKCGAAVMIGAGFSRCSSTHVDGTRKLPLWSDFAKKLAYELNGANRELTFSDPLRLAEEYRAYFGQAALNDLIRSEVHDAAWQPGQLHSELLSLPWSEVMTTNWDTLLERAALDIHSPIYSIVSKQSELSSARSPRIVKLHGSIDVTDQFVFAQEDYRKYPQQFAAFVNFARQVFIENELCLLGFSGDDPNFLQWAGWVRDNLAGYARRIYLVGALNLSAAQRKFLESINIAPLDLWPEVKHIDDSDLRHRKATEIFLDALLNAKPKALHKWEPTSLQRPNSTSEDHLRKFKDHAYAALLLEAQIETLQRDRASYPGWLICPPGLDRRLQSQICDPYPNQLNIALLNPISRANLLYEIAWRHIITFTPVPSWLATELAAIADPAIQCALTKRQQMDLLLLLLRTARLNDDDLEFEKWTVLLEKHALNLPDCAAEIAYQKALRARRHFDYEGIDAVVAKIQGEDPVWKLKQASLLGELGRFDEGESLISEAHKSLLERSRHDPNSIRLQSRLAWAHWLSRLVDFHRHVGRNDEFPTTYKSLRCDPWDHITYLKERASKQQEEYLKSQENIEPLFEQGHYRDHSGDTKFTSDIPLMFLMEGLTENVGLPLRWNHVNLLASTAEQLVMAEDLVLANFTLAISCATSDSSSSITKMFSRISLANTSQEVIDVLARRLAKALEYWRRQVLIVNQKQKNHAIDMMRILLEVLARLSLRLSAEEAKKMFRLGLEIGQSPALRFFWLFEVTEHLIKYSLKSIPITQQSELLYEALAFPLASEISIDRRPDTERWPNPVIDAPYERKTDSRLDVRISELINFSVSSNPSRSAALLRLMPLIENNTLRKDELEKLAVRLWGESPDYGNLPNTGLLSHALLTLPAPSRTECNLLLSRTLFDFESDSFFTSVHLSGLTGAATAKTNSLRPSEENASKCFDHLVGWRPTTESDDPLGIQRRDRKALIEDIGEALSLSIVPSLNHEAITEDRFKQLWTLYLELGSFPVVMGFPYFTGLNSTIVNTAANTIRKSMQGRTANEVRWAAHALRIWKTLSATGKAPDPPDNLLSKMLYLIESGRTIGLPTLLWNIGEMLKNGWLSPAEIDLLANCLPDLYRDSEYSEIRATSAEAVVASLIRQTCVELALNVCKIAPHQALGEMIESAKNDVLPEVRFAAQHAATN